MNQPNPILVFDRALIRQRRNRVAGNFNAHSVLSAETAAHLVERLGDVKRDFASVLYVGANTKIISDYVAEHGIQFVVRMDISEKMLRQQEKQNPVIADEEFLPFATGSFDLVVGNLNLHWVNDLPGTLAQIRYTLRPDGLFMAALAGGKTLHELHVCLMEAELSVMGGVSPRLSPTIELSTASGLLQRAGFSLPVADQETITFSYPDAFALMRDLRGMGETNAHLHRLRHPTRRAVFFEAARLYQQRFAGTDGRILATFEILFLHGWK